ncbi:MAG: hypothetical protein BroJett025_09400 [Patescibacteria group bacterium]|nr:MAG: hypothetical protein BroJett025_09400 [Patescibacteria group bacterium]
MKQFQRTNILRQIPTAVLVFVSRLNVLPANISPLGSYGFFGNSLLFAVSIVAFDVLVKGMYPGFWLTYIGFACYAVLGKLSKNSLKRQLVFLPFASFLFFLISNLGVWWYWYGHTIADLLLCYTVAIPFYSRTLIGDLFFGYTYILLSNFTWIRKTIFSLAAFQLRSKTV